MKKLLVLMGLLVGFNAYSNQQPIQQEMSPGTKVITAIGVGGFSGYVFAYAAKASVALGGLAGLACLGAALFYLRQGREDAVTKSVGTEYLGISALTAVATALFTHNNMGSK